MDKESRYKKIEQYLNNELRGKALTDFEQQLKTDKTLAQDVFLAQDVEEAIEDSYLDTEFAPKLRVMSKEYFKEDIAPNSTPTSFNYRRIITLLLLLGGIGLLGILVWNYFTPQKVKQTPTDQIFAAYFQPYASDNIKRDGSTSIVSYQKGLEAYKAQDYTKAIPILKEALAASPTDTGIKMVLGNSYLSTKQAQFAIPIFQTLANDDTHLYTEAAQWYLALAYVQNKQPVLAQPVLQTIADKKTGKYPKLAQEVLDKL